MSEEEKSNQQKLFEQRQRLPIYQHREEILDALKTTQTLVIIGETGSGKTTQIAQFLHEANYTRKGMIGITQPRRVVAHRVAEEMGIKIGEEVGYSIRFTDRTSSRTQIKYMTDGTLLRECLLDPDLKQFVAFLDRMNNFRYSVIVLDEAHERSVHTDILFGLMKRAIARRSDLKLLVTSATLEEEKFSLFFGKCPLFFVPGRSFPVDIFYLEKPPNSYDYVDSAVNMVMQIHEREEEGDILLFLTGQGEIERACDRIRRKVDDFLHKFPEGPDLLALPLYAALPPSEQVKVFEFAPSHCRKVVVATNIAETSLTVEGISYVIDPGYVKQKGFNPRTGMETLEVSQISQVAAQQRAGRAGRTKAGKCFRLYTRTTFEGMDRVTVPEIQRTNLATTVLTLKVLGIHDVLTFEFLDPPDPFLLIQAVRHLHYLGAIDSHGKITSLGKQMSAFPLEPSYARMLIHAVENECSADMVDLIAMMSVEQVFFRPSAPADQIRAEEARKELYRQSEESLEGDLSGDHFFLLWVFQEWLHRKKSSRWVEKYFLQRRRLEEALDIQQQLLDLLKSLKLPLRSLRGAARFERLGESLTAGLFMNTARQVSTPLASKDREEGTTYRILKQSQLAQLHPQSGLRSSEKPLPSHILYTDLVATPRPFLRLCSTVRSNWVEPYLEKFADVDLPLLLGTDLHSLLHPSSTSSSDAPEGEDLIGPSKHARRNDDSSVQAAKERYLKRKQEQLLASQKKK